MQSIPQIIDAFGGASAFARVIGRGASTASEMKRTGSINARYWEEVVEAARARGIAGVTLECLARLHARKRDGRPPIGRPGGAPTEQACAERSR
jgi:hypothetical protein